MLLQTIGTSLDPVLLDNRNIQVHFYKNIVRNRSKQGSNRLQRHFGNIAIKDLVEKLHIYRYKNFKYLKFQILPFDSHEETITNSTHYMNIATIHVTLHQKVPDVIRM